MANYYSQYGEDFLLDQLFKGKTNGFFVEVGCIDGRRFSNTLTFEERGWKGLCVEAHEDYIDLLRRNRPNSIVCHCAVGEKDEDDVIFYANSRGSLSTLDRSREHYFKCAFENFFTGFKKQTLRKRTLDSLFVEHAVNKIDVLSVDVEGYEVNVLRGLDFKKYRPKVLVVESDSPKHERCLDDIIIPSGYTKSVKVASDVFYLKDKKMRRRIENRLFEIELIHTRHPLDEGKDRRVTTVIDTMRKKDNPKNMFHLGKVFAAILRRTNSKVHFL